VQVDAPESAAYVLAGHVAQVKEPAAAVYWPAAQPEHDAAALLPAGTKTVPAAQVGQAVMVAVEHTGALPAHDRAPQHEYDPAAHAAQLPLRSAG
jgi:hypothetical protein